MTSTTSPPEPAVSPGSPRRPRRRPPSRKPIRHSGHSRASGARRHVSFVDQVELDIDAEAPWSMAPVTATRGLVAYRAPHAAGRAAGLAAGPEDAPHRLPRPALLRALVPGLRRHLTRRGRGPGRARVPHRMQASGRPGHLLRPAHRSRPAPRHPGPLCPVSSGPPRSGRSPKGRASPGPPSHPGTRPAPRSCEQLARWYDAHAHREPPGPSSWLPGGDHDGNLHRIGPPHGGS